MLFQVTIEETIFLEKINKKSCLHNEFTRSNNKDSNTIKHNKPLQFSYKQTFQVIVFLNGTRVN